MSSPYYDDRGRGTATGFSGGGRHRRPPRRQFGLLVVGLVVLILVLVIVKVATGGSGTKIVPSTAIAPPTTVPVQVTVPTKPPNSPGATRSPPSLSDGGMETPEQIAAVQKLIDYGKPVYCGGG